eukprot:6664860-Alexandrium_andersonii.AAC.1
MQSKKHAALQRQAKRPLALFCAPAAKKAKSFVESSTGEFEAVAESSAVEQKAIPYQWPPSVVANVATWQVGA